VIGGWVVWVGLIVVTDVVGGCDRGS
jgi:hypothetical protein